jgi:glycine/sarcosine N-methyltransferase
MSSPKDFYNGLADVYHLIFEDWDRSVARQGEALASVVERWSGPRRLVLDVACGIGTQTGAA